MILEIALCLFVFFYTIQVTLVFLFLINGQLETKKEFFLNLIPFYFVYQEFKELFYFVYQEFKELD